MGSANLSETAFSGRQAETGTVFDDDPVAWEHFGRQYDDVRAVATSRHEESKPATSRSYDGRTLSLSGQVMSLEADDAQVASDVAAWLEFFGNYANGFVGDAPWMQRDYFTFVKFSRNRRSCCPVYQPE